MAQSHVEDALSFSGTSDMAKGLIDGATSPAIIATGFFVQQILLKCHRQAPELSAEITLEEMKARYKNWEPRTRQSVHWNTTLYELTPYLRPVSCIALVKEMTVLLSWCWRQSMQLANRSCRNC